MNNKRQKKNVAAQDSRQWWAGPAAFLASLLALPVNAGILIPDDPLTTSARVAPNILFILDDSGSMEWRYMYSQTITKVTGSGSFSSTSTGDNKTKDSTNDSESNSNAAMYDQNYATNSLYYNPSVAYQPWMGADRNRLAGGQEFTSVFSNNLNVTSTAAGTTSAAKNLSSKVQTFYVPKNGGLSAADLSKIENYYRYQILSSESTYTGNAGKIIRSEYSSTKVTADTAAMGCSTAGTGTYGWRNCTQVTPTGRSEADEKANFATWYSYHRTRTKAAKAGAAEAFSPLDSKVRVGFRTIWNRSNFDIPVQDGNDGRFVDVPADPKVEGSVSITSRSTWYKRLFAAGASNGTPLHDALTKAGEYFSSSDTSGPYGPQSGVDQYSCRQNFAILTTDGYWNGTASGGEQDGADGSTITGPKGKSYTYNSSSDRKWPYEDSSNSNTLADVAMKYWKNDLRTDLDNNVPSSDADPAFWQHMVTFGISIGLSGTRGWASVEDAKNATTNKSWPKPAADSPNNIDDLLHAAVNGRGAFVAASSPAEFTAGLAGALSAIAQRTGSFSNVAANSTSLNTGSKAFSASYVSGIWTGQVKGQSVDRNGVSDGWVASIPVAGARKVFTVGGVAFPTTAQQTTLARTGGVADYPVTGQDNANYIKGDASQEERNGGVLRNRPTTVLGDIVGSSPAYVKESDTLYVGANDGMLHAFNAANGQELFAYVPGIINIGRLATLSRGDYTHKFFVDGPVVTSSRSVTPNKTILVGTLGRGGKGLYALNVTNPAAASASSVAMWERGETTDSNMGLVLGRPIISTVQGASTAAVIMGNGINSTNGRAVLIVLNAETGAVIREIDTGAGSDKLPNGLSAPTGVYGADGKTLAYVYAGDMLGNVWKFDLSGASSASWTVTKLFTATDAKDVAQPISSAVTIAAHPVTGKRWIFFGTGRYLTEGDASASNQGVQSMYGFMEDSATLSRSDLTGRTMTVTSATQSGYSVRAFQAKDSLPANSKGWYVDLPDAGERIVQDAQVVSTFLVTASMVPTGTACDADGRGYINALDAFTGTSAGGSYFDLDNDPSTDDKVKGLPIGSVDAGVGMPTLPNLMRGVTLLGGSGGTISTLRTLTPRWDRVSWRELRKE